MRDTTLRIKNLAYALEAVSRINNAVGLYGAIEGLLRHEIETQTRENFPPAIPRASTADDDIPF